MAAADNEASVRRYWDEFWTKGSRDAAADFYARKYRENGVELTPEEFAAGAKTSMDKFENLSATVERLWACGDRVVASRVRYPGKHVGDFKSVPATGKETEITGNDIFEFDENGKVVDHWHEADHLLLYQQVGGEIRAKTLLTPTAQAAALKRLALCSSFEGAPLFEPELSATRSTPGWRRSLQRHVPCLEAA